MRGKIKSPVPVPKAAFSSSGTASLGSGILSVLGSYVLPVKCGNSSAQLLNLSPSLCGDSLVSGKTWTSSESF